MAIANCFVKKPIVAKLGEKYNFATIVYPTVKVSIFVQIGQGIITYLGVILTINTKYVIISRNCGIEHYTAIGDYSSVLWGSNFSGYNIIEEIYFVEIGSKFAQEITIKNK